MASWSVHSALVSGSSGTGSSPGQGHCVVFLGKTVNSQCVSPPRCLNAGGSPAMD